MSHSKPNHIKFILILIICIFSTSKLFAEYKYSPYPDSVLLKIEHENKSLESQVEALEEYFEIMYHIETMFYKGKYHLPILKKYEQKVFVLNNDIHTSKFYLAKGSIYYNLYSSDSSLVYYFKAFELAKDINYIPVIVHSANFIAFSNLGMMNKYRQNPKMASKYFHIAYLASLETDDPFAKASANWSRSEMFSNKNKDSSEYYVKKAVSYLDELPASKAHLKLFGIYLCMSFTKEKDTQKQFLQKGIKYIKEIEANRICVLLSIDHLYSELYARAKQYDKSAHYAKKYLSSQKELGKELIRFSVHYYTYTLLYRYNKELGNYKEALYFHEKYLDFLNMTSTQDERVTTLEITNQLENERYLSEKKMQSQRQIFILIISGVLLLIVFIVSLYFFKRSKDRKRVNDKLTILNATKDKLFSIVSHDLRSPVAGFKQMLDAITLNYDRLNEDAKREYITSLRNSSNHLYLMLDNLLSWAKINIGNIHCDIEELDANLVAANEIEIIDKALETKNLSVQFIGLTSPIVNADGNIIRIIVRNLLANAMKYSHEGGKIEVAMEQKEALLSIKVKDYGKGMPQETISSIKQGKMVNSGIGTSNELGNGLGLSIVCELAELHGGGIEIDSLLGQGTTVTAYLAVK